MIRYRFRFAKDDNQGKGFVSSIESVKRMFALNFELYTTSKGARFSFGPALPFGWASESEYIDVIFKKRENEGFVRDIIEKNTPEGFRLIGFKTIPLYFPSVESATDIVEIEIETSDSVSELFFDGGFDFIYDLRLNPKIINLLVYYKKASRNILRGMIERIDLLLKIKKITRKNLYWLDSYNRIRGF
ncbi:MAG: DUF2344 domain-containing protein [Elusimicrobiales bacterium]